MIIKSDIALSDTEFSLMQMHSVMNLLTIINGDLQILESVLEDDPELVDAVKATFDLAKAMRAGEHEKFTPEELMRLGAKIRTTLKHTKEAHPELFETEEDALMLENFESIFTIFAERVEEIRLRLVYPDRWETYPIESFKQEFKDFFTAVEKNSKGRFRIIYNIADQSESDYFVALSVESKVAESIRIPILLKDTLRDLLANARKYTPPGGSIQAGVTEDEYHFRFVVSDTGIGIPPEELTSVVKFGYRATNVRHMKTMGGGYGLTKALWVCNHYGGQMSIESEMGRGTRIEMDIPIPNGLTQEVIG
jgi:signal transduction histidine kinase